MEKYFYWFGFLAYSVLVIVIGWRGFRRSGAAEEASLDYWAAGRSLSGAAAGLSISASFMSVSWSVVYAVQLFYWYGLAGLWLVPLPWLVTMAGFYLLVPVFRKLPSFSQPEMIAHRFGNRARAFLAVPLAFVFLVWGGAEIYAAAHILSPLLDAPFPLVLLLIALIVATYSWLGGFSAVVATDKVQFLLVALFIATIAGIAVTAAGSEISFLAAVSAIERPAYVESSAVSLWSLSPVLIAMTFLAYVPGWLVETDVWLRLQAAKTVAAARKGVLIATVNSLVFLTLLPLVIGLAALYLYPATGGVIPERLQDGAAIIAVLMQDHAPLWLSVVLSTGLAAAAMSTIDTCSNVVALSLSYDIIEPALQKKSSPEQMRKIARAASAFAVMLAFVYALFTESLWDIFYLSSGILTTTVFIPMLAIFSKKATEAQVKAAAAVGFLSTFLFYFLEKGGLLAGVQPGWLGETGLGYILWGGAAALLAYAVAGWMHKRSRSV